MGEPEPWGFIFLFIKWDTPSYICLSTKEEGTDMKEFDEAAALLPPALRREAQALPPLVRRRVEEIRLRYLEEGKKKEDWYDMIQLLPSSYNQMRTCTLNYETLANIYDARNGHKLAEWNEFCRWVESLPYAKEIIIGTC